MRQKSMQTTSSYNIQILDIQLQDQKNGTKYREFNSLIDAAVPASLLATAGALYVPRRKYHSATQFLRFPSLLGTPWSHSGLTLGTLRDHSENIHFNGGAHPLPISVIPIFLAMSISVLIRNTCTMQFPITVQPVLTITIITIITTTDLHNFVNWHIFMKFSTENKYKTVPISPMVRRWARRLGCLHRKTRKQWNTHQWCTQYNTKHPPMAGPRYTQYNSPMALAHTI